MKSYDPKQIEPKWQKIWDETQIYQAKDNDSRTKYYYLVEFPYPSGDGLHVGHVRSYSAVDIMARHKRMQNFNVLYPMGWDAFGLPTENYAIKHKVAPQEVAAQNIANFKRQMKSLGLGFDWSREINTTDPQYYKWTQWIFLQFFKAGLAYQAEIPINWCPFEKTGLANEEVVDGKHERCGTPVEKKLLKQWLLKITAYADRLLSDLDTVDYLDKIAVQQINWIGKSEGAEVEFKLHGITGQADDKHSVTVYTTRPDTLGGATFVVVSPELASKWLEVGWKASKEVKDYIHKSLNESELERQDEKRDKTGVDTGIKAINPLNNEEVPVWVADYVLGGYGTGAIMAVPAHDQRDYEFATKFKLPIRIVIDPITGSKQDQPEHKNKIVALVQNDKGEILTINWGPKLGGRLLVGGTAEKGEDPVQTATREVAEETGYHGLKLLARGDETIHHEYFAHSKGKPYIAHTTPLHFKLTDDQAKDQKLEDNEKGKFKVEWVSREQAATEVVDPLHRYVFDKFVEGRVYVAPGILVNSGQFDGLTSTEAKKAIVDYLYKEGKAKGATKYKLRDWIFSRQHYWGEPIPIIHCPIDGAVPVPDEDLPVELPLVKSYEPTDTGESPLAAITDWVNVKCPQCGGAAKRETDTMPNWAGSSWYYLRYVDPHNDQAFADPAKLKHWLPVDLYNGGMEHTTLHLLYSRFWHKFLFDQGLVPTPEPYAVRRSHGMVLAAQNAKMSKSRGNVINPDKIVESYGADTLRLYEMFMGPFDEATSWSDERLAGVSRFIRRVWDLSQKLLANDMQSGQPEGAIVLEVDRWTHKTIKKVHEHIEGMHFNTMVSALMEYTNFLTNEATLKELTEPRHAELARRTLRTLVLILAPITPHMAEELWSQLGGEGSVHLAAWPKYDPELIKDDLIEIVVQVNGKLRATMTVPAETGDKELEELAKQQEAVQKHLGGKSVAKTIVVPRKLVNFVVK